MSLYLILNIIYFSTVLEICGVSVLPTKLQWKYQKKEIKKNEYASHINNIKTPARENEQIDKDKTKNVNGD